MGDGLYTDGQNFGTSAIEARNSVEKKFSGIKDSISVLTLVQKADRTATAKGDHDRPRRAPRAFD